MDRFLWCHNPNKQVSLTGLQGYVMDTVSGLLWAVNHSGKNHYELTLEKIYIHHPAYLALANRAARWLTAYMNQTLTRFEITVNANQINGFNDH